MTQISTKITPRQLIPLPWDDDQTEPRPEAPQLTAEQQRQRFETLRQKL